ncbi:MAG: histidine--tRNA ligase [Bacillota bacterium]|nr:histidine--tRNA ligase [Bacillota bacterium]
MPIQTPRGMEDVLPADSWRWEYVEALFRDLAARYGYREIRTPVVEATELFERGVGSGTDVVEKEMYTFLDPAGRSLTLRPEGTAGAVRAYIQHHLEQEPGPVKLYYVGAPMFRYERPQAGRQRQFYQFGVEVLGAGAPTVDAEVVALGVRFLEALGVEGVRVELNSIGDPVCRPRYREALLAYYRPLRDRLCQDCQRRLERNPLRLLDCKVDRELAAAAPSPRDWLCADCARHYEEVKRLLGELGVEVVENPHLVRGLDYYTRTVFELVSDRLGAQSAVLSGGRYDGLVEGLGGPATPGIGFAGGMERLLALLPREGPRAPAEPGADVFVALVEPERAAEGLAAAERLRAAGLRVEVELEGRSLKAQMRYASRRRFRLALLVGGSEAARGEVTLRDLGDGRQQAVPWSRLEERLARLATRRAERGAGDPAGFLAALLEDEEGGRGGDERDDS